MATTDVAVVGGGVIGCAIAYYLAKAGVEVTIFEKEPSGGQTSAAAAGMLAPISEAANDDPFFHMGVKGLSMYPDLAAQLREETGIDILYTESGIIRIALTEEEREHLRGQAEVQQRELGLDVRWLDSDEARRLEPGLSPEVQGAVFSPQERHVSSPRLVQALTRAALAAGASLRTASPVLALLTEGRRVTGVRLHTEDISARWVVLASGSWSSQWGRTLGFSTPVFPVRGQIVALQEVSPPLRYVVYSERGYLVPKADGLVLAGTTVERCSNFDMRATAAGVSSILAGATAMVPSLDQATVRDAWAGLRPGSADGLPLLGPLPNWDGVIMATGHYRNGILLAPITGRLISQFITGAKPEVPLEPFNPGRFGTLA